MLTMTLLKRRGGTLPAAFLSLTLLLIAGCREASVITQPDAKLSLYISGVMTSQRQYIRVSRESGSVTNAEVTVNGVPLPLCCGDLYSGSLPEPVPAGGTLNLKVVAGGVSVEASGEVTATPTITAPAAGSTFNSTDSVSLAWSTPMDPDRFEVCLNCWENSHYAASYTIAGSSREFKIAPGTLVDFGTGAVAVVSAFKSNFLKSSGSRTATANVQFVTSSRDALINIKY